MRLDIALKIELRTDIVAVLVNTENQVETSATHLGEVVSAAQMTALPLNGRSYTDLLAIQPGVAPISTLLPSSVIMAGVTGSLDPSGDLNPGNLFINGQRESSNGFLVNGIDVQEHMNGGTSIIPNLDSIEEFRVLTTNLDSEYGNYNGGMVTVISKAGSNQLHGEVLSFSQHCARCAWLFRSHPPSLPTKSIWRSGGGTFQERQIVLLYGLSGHEDNRGHFDRKHLCA